MRLKCNKKYWQMEQHSIAFFVNTCYPALMEDAMKDEETDERGEEKNIGKKKKKRKSCK